MSLPAALKHDGNDPAALELPRRGAGAKELTGQIDTDHGVPLLQRHRIERRIPLQPGVADADVQRTKMGDGIGQHLFDFVFIADIGL